jgi:HK97 family phage portal protein
MNVFKRMFGNKNAPTIIDSPDKLASVLGYSYDTYTGKAITTTKAMQMATVFSCVRVLSESVGMLPCKLYRQHEQDKREARTHRLYRLLNVAPNDYMTAQEFWELLVASLCLRGNFYAYKVRALGQVQELLPLDPAAVTVTLDDAYQPEYHVTWRNGQTATLGQDDIWHVRLFTLDGIHGLSPITYAREAIAMGLATEEHGSRLFQNGAVTSGVLATDQQLSDAAFSRLKKQFEENHQGLANAHKPMILEMGLKWQSIAISAEDSQFLETRKYQRDEICGIFRVPPHLIANLEKATFSNIEHQSISFVNYSLVPYLTRIEQRIRMGLLSQADQSTYYARFNTGALLRGDLKSRYDAYAVGINWGFLSPNDVRVLEDMNPREGGNTYLTPLNMTTKPEENDKKPENTDANNDKTAI